jgi:hypothetical protein
LVCPSSFPGNFREASEHREGGGVLARCVLGETGLEKGLLIKGNFVLGLFLAGHGGENAREKHKVVERVGRGTLFEEMLTHGHVGAVGEDIALIVADDRVQHGEAALVLLVVHELHGFIEKVLRLRV